jgi:DNA repair exonuclease SbcCD ATPase subunit
VAREQAASLETANDELRAKLDAVSMDLARRLGEREELAWRIAELEQQVSRLEAEQTELTLTVPPPPMASASAAPPVVQGPSTSRRGGAEGLASLQEELDILRQAMAQEHAARVRAESGEELEKARAELARQAILLEQLSRELDARDHARQARATGATSDRDVPGRSVDRTEP